MIRATYETDPDFPETAQHPDCLRTVIDGRVVDYIGVAPTPAEIQEHLNPPKPPKDAAEQLLDAVRANPGRLAAIKVLLGLP